MKTIKIKASDRNKKRTRIPRPDHFGTWVKITRENRGMSQEELSIKTGIKPATIAKIETIVSCPRLENFEKLVLALMD